MPLLKDISAVVRAEKPKLVGRRTREAAMKRSDRRLVVTDESFQVYDDARLDGSATGVSGSIASVVPRIERNPLKRASPVYSSFSARVTPSQLP